MHLTLACHPGHAAEARGDDLDPKMGFAPGPRAGVTGMQMRLVGYRQSDRRHPGLQLVFDSLCDRHMLTTPSTPILNENVLILARQGGPVDAPMACQRPAPTPYSADAKA